jgi:hypothetical protein
LSNARLEDEEHGDMLVLLYGNAVLTDMRWMAMKKDDGERHVNIVTECFLDGLPTPPSIFSVHT